MTASTGAGQAATPAQRFRNPLDPRHPLSGLFLATGLFELAEGALRFLVPINLDARGLAPAQIGFVIFAFSLTSLIARGVAGVVFRPGRARALIIGAGLASTVAYLLTPFVSDVASFTVLMAVDGFGWGIATTCLFTMLLLCTPATIPPVVAMGWYIGFQGLALAIATTVGGLLGESIGIGPAMLVLATLPVLAAVFVSVRLPPVLHSTTDPARAADPVGRARPATRARLSGSIRRTALLPFAVWSAALVAVYLNVINGLLQSFFPLLGLALGLSVAQIGTLSSVRTGISSIARFGAGWIFQHVRPGRIHLPLLTLSAATLAILPSVGSWLVLMPLFAANGISRGLLRVTTSATAMDETPGHQAGMAAAVMTAGLDIGKMLGPLIGGVVAGAIGIEAMFRIVPFAFLAIYIILFVASERRRRMVVPAHPDQASPSTPPSLAEEP
ncbi:MAG TPA: MFS transporter [Patescibacteria group bacterium]|nr:MFS transporter [Patescibacteria group bacterium]